MAGRPVEEGKKPAHSVSKNSQSISVFQFRQFVAKIDHLGQAGTQEIALLFSAGMLLHHGAGICKVSRPSIRNPAISCHSFAGITE
ncbi:hypothetical protein P775_01905 [Puniceibacterium antarcticum]|uniref:Uncharacterized protein n=1 Tax=Puniceibacterium antarcticum TaxID=1206336 RepID=A0A2G8RKH2_9RHOB|nr:hypothetical protein P775_01905 [Puniceibacterium antarcticum]